MYYFIVNPKSKSGKGMSQWKNVKQILSDSETDHKVFFTRYTGHGCELSMKISRIMNEKDTLIVMGGDGTLNEVIEGLENPDSVSFAYIPIGSGNDFARGTGIERDLSKSLSTILEPSEIKKLDICTCDTGGSSRQFAVSSGIGFDAAICHEALDSPIKKMLNKLRLGKLSYTLIALKQLLFFRPFQLSMIMDDGREWHFSSVYFAAAMNLPYEGGGFQFAPDARGDDGYLDLIVVSNISKLKVLFLLPIAFFGKHTSFKGVRILRCRRAELCASRPMAVHADGESVGISKKIQLSAGPHQINLITR